MIVLAALAFCLLPLDDVPAPISLPNSVFADEPGDDAVDLVVFGSSRVAFVRVHARINDRGFRSAWLDTMTRLYSYLDRNRDGILTASEAGRVPWTNLLQGPFPNNRQVARPANIDANRDQKVSFEEFTAYVQNSLDFGPIGLQNGSPPDARTESVFGLLDHNGDRKISAAELASTDARLALLDRDENGLLDQTEITPDLNPPVYGLAIPNTPNPPTQRAADGIVALTTDEVRAAVALRIVTTYGKGGDKPGAKVVGPSAFLDDSAEFRAADTDGDGSLSLNELTHSYLPLPPPDCELVLNLRKGGQAGLTLEPGSRTTGTFQPRKKPGGALEAGFDETEIDLTGANNVQEFEQSLVQQFSNVDADKDGFLDLKESRTNNNVFSPIFLVADLDDDKKLSQAEIRSYAGMSEATIASRITLTISDRGADLFQKLDANRDGQLSIRELRKARSRLQPMDRNHDGSISFRELPRRFELGIGRGVVQNAQAGMMPMGGMAPTAAAPISDVLPSWFTGMDQNRDGDVSAREFLGPPAIFRQLDRDGDGLIDAIEAAKAAEL